MKKLLTVGTATLLIALTPISAFADKATVANSGRTETGGWVEFSAEPSNSLVSPYSLVFVDNGKGEWDYGSEFAGIYKYVHSHLRHTTKEHKSSCKCGNVTSDSGWKKAGVRSLSSIDGRITDSSSAYWDIVGRVD